MKGPSMRYLFISLLCAACVETSPGPDPDYSSGTPTGGIRPAKGNIGRPNGEPAPPPRDPQLREAPPEITLDGAPIDVGALDDVTSADLERCMISVRADVSQFEDVAVTRTCGRFSVTLYPTAN